MTRGIFVPFKRRNKRPRFPACAPANPTAPAQAECSTCFDLDFDLIPQPHKNPKECSIGQPVRYWISSNALSNNESCKSCWMLKSAFDTLIAAWGIGVVPGNAYQIAIIEQVGVGLDDGDRSSGSPLKIIMRCHPEGESENGVLEEFEIEIYSPLNDPCTRWKSIGPAGEVPTNPSGEECATFAQRWVDNCDANHALCRQLRGSNEEGDIMPRRVLDLSNNHIRLVETTPGQRGRYVALSHCWGKEQLLTTTRDTLASRMDGINIEDMPLTFQDSIKITRGLGLRYIWIDSLCIIQKDAEDWEEQSAVMADIYARCYLNIAATRAGGGNEGVLKPRYTRRDSIRWLRDFSQQANHRYDPATHVPRIRDFLVQSFKVPLVEEDIRIRVALWSSHEPLQTSRMIQLHQEIAPLLPRTWVYQERTLAPRSLHIHSSEMTWICNEKQRCECRALDASPLGGDGWSATKAQISKLSEIKDLKVLRGIWRTIVEDVSILDLSFESDRLPSLAGLASRFSENMPPGERYLAGLWEGDLARDLLWESGGSKQTKGPTRQRISGAPSWSWASLSWGGDHGSGLKWEHETKPKLVPWAGSTTYIQDVRTRITDVSVQVPGKNRFGTVAGGSITVEGALCCIVDGNQAQLPGAPPCAIPDVLTLDEGSFNSLHLNYDTTDDAEAARGGIVYCLFIGSFIEVFDDSNDLHIEHCGLMLKPAQVKGKYQRVGRWKQYVESWTKQKNAWTKKASVVQLEIV